MASSQRIKKVNELIKRELGNIILKRYDFPNNVLVTVTNIETSRDLSECKVYVFVVPEKESASALGLLKSQVYGIQQALNRRLRMRPVPKIRFVEDKELEQAGKIEKILDEAKRADLG